MNNNIEEVLALNGFLILPVKGDSMMPLLNQETDTVRLTPIIEPLKKYDIPLYRRPSGQLVLHRIIKVTENGFYTCGDNRYIKEFVPYDWCIATAEGIFKGENYISLDSDEMCSYAKAIVRKRRFRWLKSLPKRILKKLKLR